MAPLCREQRKSNYNNHVSIWATSRYHLSFANRHKIDKKNSEVAFSFLFHDLCIFHRSSLEITRLHILSGRKLSEAQKNTATNISGIDKSVRWNTPNTPLRKLLCKFARRYICLCIGRVDQLVYVFFKILLSNCARASKFVC